MESAEYLSAIILNRLADKIPVKGAVPDQYVKNEVPEVSVTSYVTCCLMSFFY